MPFSPAFVRQCVTLRQSRLFSTVANEAKRPRGRPRKTPIPTQHVRTERAISPALPAIIAKPRGRPRKQILPTILEQPQPTKRGRERPRKVDESNGDSTLESSVGGIKTDAGVRKEGGYSAPKAKGRPRASAKKSADGPIPTTRRKRRNTGDLKPVPRVSLIANKQKHHDLPSFLEYAARTNLNTTTNVYRGTHYEYTVADTLKLFSFSLDRTGRANDLGIDLIGSWTLPSKTQELKVLIQCKASTPRPSMVRELEGSYVGAPAGWRGDSVMAFLITSKPATKGVRAALQRSRLPMGFLQITSDGAPKQFLWNGVAQEARLTGMSATNVYRPIDKVDSMLPVGYRGPVESAISLLWMGKQWTNTQWSGGTQ